MEHIQRYIQRIPRAIWLIPPVMWMTFIFFLSSKQRISVSEEYWMNFAVFKMLHIIEYAILTFLNIIALFSNTRNPNLRLIACYASIVAVLYAISDELHQTFVPTREGRIRDVLIDSIGILSVYWIGSRYEKTYQKILSSFFYPRTSQ